MNTILDTDIFHKETDAHRYSSFKSTHPHYTFKSVAYSLFLRLRRIISDHNFLEFRLSEMSTFLSKSDYPTELLNSVRNDLTCKFRYLSYKNKKNEPKKFEVGWVVTFGPGYWVRRGKGFGQTVEQFPFYLAVILQQGNPGFGSCS